MDVFLGDQLLIEKDGRAGVGGLDFTTLDFLGLILGATGSIDDMSACLGLIAALADDFFALLRGSLGRGGGRTFPRDAAVMATAVLSSGESGAGFSGSFFSGIGW